MVLLHEGEALVSCIEQKGISAGFLEVGHLNSFALSLKRHHHRLQGN